MLYMLYHHMLCLDKNLTILTPFKLVAESTVEHYSFVLGEFVIRGMIQIEGAASISEKHIFLNRYHSLK